METQLLTNNVGGVKFVEVNGRQFAIAPMTILRSRVLPGSRGALYYPPEENKKVEQQWNGKPLVATSHPRLNGNNVSANQPEIFQKQEIGRFYNSKVDQAGTNTGDGYFDLELTKKHDSRIYNALMNGEKIEVSTGLYTDNEDAPANSSYDGVEYNQVARNYRPDHIAILTEEKGACSIKDGCGVFNSSGDNCGTGAGGFHPGNTYAKGSGDNTSSISEPKRIAKKLVDLITHDIITIGTSLHPSGFSTAYGDLTDEEKKDVVKDLISRGAIDKSFGRKKNPPPGTDIVKEVQFQVKKLHQSHKDKETNRHIPFQDSEEYKKLTSNELITDNPSWVKDHSKWEKAKEQAHKEGKGSDFAYITGIYKQMGGEISNNSIEETMNDWLIYNAQWTQEQRDKLPPEDFAGPNQSFPIRSQKDVHDAARLIGHADNPEAVKRKIIEIAKRKGFQIPDEWKSSLSTNNSNQPNHMNAKTDIITWLTTNCSCLKDKKTYLEGLTDNALKETILENAEKAVENDADQMFLNWISNADKDIRNAISSYMKNRINNAFGKGGQQPPNKKMPVDTTGQDTDTAGVPETDTDTAAADAMEKKKQAMMNTNSQAQLPKTAEEFIKAFPFLSSLVANHNANENAEKQQLIGKITAPITDNTAKQQAITALSGKSVEDLRLFASIIPTNNTQQQQNNPVANFFGATGGADPITDNSELQKEVLVVNQIDWSDWAKNTSIYDSSKG